MDVQADRTFGARYSTNDVGNIVIVGNTLMTCPGGTSCSSALGASASTITVNGINNNDFNMVRVDQDSNPSTFTSSSAYLALPPGSTVKWAGLYWGARTSAGTSGQAAPSPGQNGNVLFSTPVAGYTALTSSTTDVSSDGTTAYQGFREVTGLVQAGASGSYTVANVQSGSGVDRYAGWALVVVYHDSSQPPRNMVVYDGFSLVRQGITTVTIPISGFQTPPAGAVRTFLGAVTYEGDRGYVGDSFRLASGANSVLISDGLNPSTNVFNSGITRMGVNTAPTYTNQMGFDAHIFDASGVLPNGATSATATVTTGGETYYPGVITFATELYAPKVDLVKVVADLDGGDVMPGDVLEYTLTATNTGQDGAVNVVLTDPIPAFTTYVPGSLKVSAGANAGDKTDPKDADQAEFDESDPLNKLAVFRLGTGATASAGGKLSPGQSTSVKFKVRVDNDAKNRTVITNIGSVSYLGESIPNPYTSESPASSVTVIYRASVDLSKEADRTTTLVGDTVEYTITAKNTGNVPLTSVSVVDTYPSRTSYVGSDPAGVPGVGTIVWTPGSTPGTLAPGEVFTAKLRLRVDPGSEGILVNLARVTGTTISGDLVEHADIAEVTVAHPDINVEKTVTPSEAAPGSRVEFAIVVSNSGDVPLGMVRVEDSLPGGLSYVSATLGGAEDPPGSGTVKWDIGSLQPKETVELAVTAEVKADAFGTQSNGVIATGSPPLGGPVSNKGTADLQVLLPAISLVKTASPDEAAPGAEVTFTLTVENKGNAPLQEVTLVDVLPDGFSYLSSTMGGVESPSGTVTWNLPDLAVGSSQAVELVARVDQLAFGVLSNQATVSGRPPGGTPVTNSASRDVVVLQPALLVTKTSSAATGFPKDVVTFTLRVENAGDTTLSGITVTDTLPGGLTFVSASDGGVHDGSGTVTWSLDPMSPGDFKELTLVARIGDVPTGVLKNMVTASGAPPAGTAVSNSGVAGVQVLNTPGVSVLKAATPTTGAPGTVVTFTLTVTNSGNTPLYALTVEDILPGGMSFVSASDGGVHDGSGKVTWSLGDVGLGYAKDLTLTARIEDGPSSLLANTVTATALGPGGGQVAQTKIADVAVLTPAIALSKVTSPAEAAPGGEITFTLTVENVGDVPLSGVTVVDVLPAGLSYLSSDPAGINAPDGTVTWSLSDLAVGSSHALVLRARVDPGASGVLSNVASASASPPTGYAVSTTARSNVMVIRPAIKVTKAGQPNSGNPGEMVTFTITVDNVGDTPLMGVQVVDVLGPGLEYLSSTPSGTVSPAGTVTWTIPELGTGSSVVLTMVARIGDVATGVVRNKVTATGTPPAGSVVTHTASAGVQVLNTPAVSVVKAAVPSSGAPGTVVTFTVTVENVGDTPLNMLTVEDLLPDGMTFVSASDGGLHDGSGKVTWLLGDVVPGYAKDLTLTARIDDGPNPLLSNTVTATALGPVGQVTDTHIGDVAVLHPALFVTKASSPAQGAPGAETTFTLTVENAGDVPLSGVTVVDVLSPGLSYVSSTPAGTESPERTVTWILSDLAAGSSRTIELKARVDQGASGTLSNTVTATGNPPTGDSVTNTAVSDVSVLRPAISVSKAPSPASGSPGDLISFAVTVENVGVTSLAGVGVVDTLPEGLTFVSASDGGVHDGSGTVTWSLEPMNPGDSSVLTLVARLGSVGNKMLLNAVTATGTPPGASPVTHTDVAGVQVLNSPAISVSETVSPSAGAPGTEAVFTITVKNVGDTSLADVTLENVLPGGLTFVSASDGGLHDPATGTVSWSLGSMDQGATRQLTLRAVMEDGPTTVLSDTVTATGQGPAGPVSDTDMVDVTVLIPGIRVTKAAGVAGVVGGSSVTYTLNVENTGMSDLYGVTLVDTLPVGTTFVFASDGGNYDPGAGTVTWDLGVILAGGAHLPITLEVGVEVGADVVVSNVALVTGTTPTGRQVSNSALVDVKVLYPDVWLAKTAVSQEVAPGEEITYIISLVNRGGVALSNIKVEDLLPVDVSFKPAGSTPGASTADGTVTWTVPSLAVGDSFDITLVGQVSPFAYRQTLSNYVTANLPISPVGTQVQRASWDVLLLHPTLEVEKAAAPDHGAPHDQIVFSIYVRNSGNTLLSDVVVEDVLPAGLTYVSSDPGPDGPGLRWSLGTMEPGASPHPIQITTRLETGASGTLTNVVTSTGTSPGGELVHMAVEDVRVDGPAITVTKTSDRSLVLPDTDVTYTIEVVNTGTLDDVEVVDTLPEGISFVSSSLEPLTALRSDGTTTVIWDLGRLDQSGSTTILLTGHVDEGASGFLVNGVKATGMPPDGILVRGSSQSSLSVIALTVNKTANQKAVRRGDEIIYTIAVCNPGVVPIHNVVVEDIFDSTVHLVSASPQPGEDGRWHFPVIGAGECRNITLTVEVPKSPDVNFTLEHRVEGQGYVNLRSDYDTTLPPYVIQNCVTVTSDESMVIDDCESVTVLGEPGTELKTREHGSGSYESAELVDYFSRNKSIEMNKSVAAIHRNTTFYLPGNRSIDYVSRWTEVADSRNLVTGASVAEEYRYATSIERDSHVKLDENGTLMETEADFSGAGHVGVLKKASPLAHPKTTPVFEAEEDYVGDFHLYQKVEEYGQNVRSEKEASGSGFVAADERIRSSQRTYEHGTGSYASEEEIDTPSSYVSKDVEAAWAPAGYSYTPSVVVNRSLKWKEGAWSKTSESYIGEEISGADQLDVKRAQEGLNAMRTEANYTGTGRFRVVLDDGLDVDEVYAGRYSVRRKTVLTGVSKYDRPHLTVTKDGTSREVVLNGVNTTMAEYTINVTNDGNRALGPVYVRDLFPPKTVYVGSSVGPARLEDGYANWSLTHLGVGNTVSINLRLNTTEEVASLVNRVRATGIYGNRSVSASNYSVIEFSWLGCCPSEIRVKKEAEAVGEAPDQVDYWITLQNTANSTLVANVSDTLPAGMEMIEASNQPDYFADGRLRWILTDVTPGEIVTLGYRVRALHNGTFVNDAQVDGYLVDGGSVSADASATVTVGRAPGVTRPGWNPPEWGFDLSENVCGSEGVAGDGTAACPTCSQT